MHQQLRALSIPGKADTKDDLEGQGRLEDPVYGTGINVRDWIYVMDHCRAVEQVLFKGRKGEIYNISAAEEKTNLEVIKTILHILGKDERSDRVCGRSTRT